MMYMSRGFPTYVRHEPEEDPMWGRVGVFLFWISGLTPHDLVASRLFLHIHQTLSGGERQVPNVGKRWLSYEPFSSLIKRVRYWGTAAVRVEEKFDDFVG